VSKPYDVDDEGNPAAAAEPAPEPDPAAEAVLRRQIEQTLRAMALSTVIGLIVIAVIAIVAPRIRGVMILVFFVYLVTSLAARWYLRRQFMARLESGSRG
jgi:ABC-type bacteriocin/lantibiotic exporter with double-glycine peptidase domain